MQDIPQFAQMQSVIFPFFASLLFIFAHFYIYKVLLKSTFPRYKPLFKALAVLNALLCVGYVFLRDVAHIPYALYFCLATATGVCFLSILSAIFYQICAAFIHFAKRPKRGLLRQRARIFSFCLNITLIIFSLYAGLKPPQITKLDIAIENLKAPINIALLSDLHIGGLMDVAAIVNIVASTNALKPDIIVLLGDIIDAPTANVLDTINTLKALESSHIIYVLGNHEYFHDVDNILAMMRDFGFSVLVNDSIALQGAHFIGIADMVGYRMRYLEPNLEQAFAKSLDSTLPNILLSHQPKIIDMLQTPFSADLVLSGHTHGGQIFPLQLAILLQQPFLRGLHTFGENSQLYITQGAGFWGAPMRLGSHAEITLLHLIPAP